MSSAGQLLKYCIVIVERVLNGGHLINLDGLMTDKLRIVAKLVTSHQKMIEGLLFRVLNIDELIFANHLRNLKVRQVDWLVVRIKASTVQRIFLFWGW
jgi:hypothetical protein